ncbi:hypothetical protein D3C86_1090160 [compost metagenome]
MLLLRPLLVELLALHRLALLVLLLALLLLLRPLLVELAALVRLALLVLKLALLLLRHALLVILLAPLKILALALLLLQLPLLLLPLVLERLLLALLEIGRLALLLAQLPLLLELLALHGLLLALRLGWHAAHLVWARGPVPAVVTRVVVGPLGATLHRVHEAARRAVTARIAATVAGSQCGLGQAHVGPTLAASFTPITSVALPRLPRLLRRRAPRAPVVERRPARQVRGDGLPLEPLPRHRRQRTRWRPAYITTLDRSHWRGAPALAHRQGPPRIVVGSTRHGPSFDEIARRHARDGARHIAIDPAFPVAVAAVPAPAIVVDWGVVDPRHIVLAGSIARTVDVARPERVPGNAGAATNPDGGRAAADKADHGRRIARAHADRAGHPAPAVAEMGPAAIVRRGEAPRRVIDPGPAPRRHPGPVPGAVRRPAGRHRAREPHRAVAGVLLPVAIVVQCGVAGHLARHVTRGDGLILAGVARGGPLVEAVGRRVRARAGIGKVGAGKAHALAA